MARLFIVFLLFVIPVNAYTSFNEEKMTEYIRNLENQIFTMTTKINKQQEEMATQKTAIAQQNTNIANQNTAIAQQNTKFAELNTNIANQDTLIAKQNTAIARINTRFAEAELNCSIVKNRIKPEEKQNQKEPCTCIAAIAQQNTNIANQDTLIAKQNAAIARINTRFAKAELNCSIDKNKLKPEEKQNQREPCTCTCIAGTPVNIALKKPTAQSSTYEKATADRAVDGNTMRSWSSGSCAHTNESNKDSWWCVDLLRDYNISTIKITNRDPYQERLVGFNVRFSNTGSCDRNSFNSAKVCYTEPGVQRGLYAVKGCDDSRQMSGRYVFIGGPGQYLTLCEVEIYCK